MNNENKSIPAGVSLFLMLPFEEIVTFSFVLTEEGGVSSSVTSEGGAHSPGGVGGVMGISSKPTQWYYHLCNRWLSLLGVSVLPQAFTNCSPLKKQFPSYVFGVGTKSITFFSL